MTASVDVRYWNCFPGILFRVDRSGVSRGVDLLNRFKLDAEAVAWLRKERWIFRQMRRRRCDPSAEVVLGVGPH